MLPFDNWYRLRFSCKLRTESPWRKPRDSACNVIAPVYSYRCYHFLHSRDKNHLASSRIFWFSSPALVVANPHRNDYFCVYHVRGCPTLSRHDQPYTGSLHTLALPLRLFQDAFGNNNEISFSTFTTLSLIFHAMLAALFQFKALNWRRKYKQT